MKQVYSKRISEETVKPNDQSHRVSAFTSIPGTQAKALIVIMQRSGSCAIRRLSPHDNKSRD